MAKLNIKKDDTVIVLSGDDKGAKGKVIAVSPEEGKVLVEGVNIIHKHVKPRKQGETGGIVNALRVTGKYYYSIICFNMQFCHFQIPPD